MKGLIELTKEHSSTILTFIGATGVVVTTILAVKATPKAMKLIEEEKKKRSEVISKTIYADNKKIEYNEIVEKDITSYDKFKIAWKPYIPAFLTGLGTISCIFGANILNKRTQASLMSSYLLLSKYFNEYKYEANNTYVLEEGKNANQTIQKSLFERKIKKDPPKDISINNDEMLIYLPLYATTHFNDGYITTSKDIMLNLEKRINDEMDKEGYICINKIYSWLGINNKELPAWGWQYGWVKLDNIDYSDNYRISLELTKCVLDDDSLDCWFVDVICPPEMQSFV